MNNMINNLEEVEEMCLSGAGDIKAYKRNIKVVKYNCLSNNISDNFHTFLQDRLLFNKLNKIILNYDNRIN